MESPKKREFNDFQIGENKLRKLGMLPWRREGLDTSEPPPVSGEAAGTLERDSGIGETGKLGLAPQIENLLMISRTLEQGKSS